MKASGAEAPTVADLAERYIRDYAEARKKPSSVYEDRRLLANRILPRLGRIAAKDVTRFDVDRLHQGLRETPYEANRVLALLSKMFNLAERWGLRTDGTNPCRHIERFREHPRNRILSGDEPSRLGKALDEAVQQNLAVPSAVTAIKILLLTGARLGEILRLRWDQVDFEHSCLRLPDSKTGTKTIPLGGAALQVLRAATRFEGNPHVIWGSKEGAHLTDLEKPWRRIRAAAGMKDVRLHDLRRTFGSLGAVRGMGLKVVGELLGHRDSQTTARYYSVVPSDPIKDAAERICSEIAASLGQDTGKVLDFANRARREAV
ncbi:MAG: tyrosine-type recombinase/integrase [Acidobacteriota bacterium]